MKTIIAILVSFSVAASAQTKHTVPISGGGTGQTSAGIALNADTAIGTSALTGTGMQFTTVANQRYYVTGQIIATSSTAAGFKLGVRIPSGDTGSFIFEGTDTTTLQSNFSTVTADSGLTASYGQLNGTAYVTFSGFVSGPTAGPVIIGGVKNGTGTLTVKQWSGLVWKRIY